MPTLKVSDLAAHPSVRELTTFTQSGMPAAPFVIVDPGKKTGGLVWTPTEPWGTTDIDLDELPMWLGGVISLIHPCFVGVEDYSLTGGNRRNDPKVPAAQGIGMVRAVCALMHTPCVLIQRGTKSAGHAALDERGQEAFKAARNDHRRDVVDMCGFVLRELRTAAHNAALRP
jgi:hypothetical protein